MQFSRLKKVAEKGKISLIKFYAESNISYRERVKMREENFVPAYVRKALMYFIEKEIKRRNEDFIEIKDKFFTRAKRLGFKEKDGLIQIPIFSNSADIEISAVESQFISMVK